jgi:hypothetical protein
MTSTELAKLGMYRAAAIKYGYEEKEDFKRYETIVFVVILIVGTLVVSWLYGDYLR